MCSFSNPSWCSGKMCDLKCDGCGFDSHSLLLWQQDKGRRWVRCNLAESGERSILTLGSFTYPTVCGIQRETEKKNNSTCSMLHNLVPSLHSHMFHAVMQNSGADHRPPDVVHPMLSNSLSARTCDHIAVLHLACRKHNILNYN